MFPADVIDDEVALNRGGADWRQVLDRWDAEVVVWARNSPIDLLLSQDPGWRLAYADQSWVVHLRR
jgi:hypothetical protein